MQGLMLHAGGVRLERSQLVSVPTPEGTNTWRPVPHAKFVNEVEAALTSRNLRVVKEEHGVNKEQYFGLLTVQNGHNSKDYSWVVGLRNSHNKTLPAGLVVGSQVFVCDNLAFSGEIQVSRKHTPHILYHLPYLIQNAIKELISKWASQDQRIERYKSMYLPVEHAHNLVVKALQDGAVCATGVPEVLKEYHQPTHEEFQPRTMWSLFNAFTHTLKGSSPLILQKRTIVLHNLFDSYRV